MRYEEAENKLSEIAKPMLSHLIVDMLISPPFPNDEAGEIASIIITMNVCGRTARSARLKD